MSSRVLEVFAERNDDFAGFEKQSRVQCLVADGNPVTSALKASKLSLLESSDFKPNFLSSGLDLPCLLHVCAKADLKHRINTPEADRKQDAFQMPTFIAQKEEHLLRESC